MAQEENKPSYAELEALYAALLKRSEEEQTQLGEANALVGELNEQLSNAQAGQEASAVVVITHEKVQYRVLAAKFQHKGKEYLAKELSKHADVVAALVESGSGLLHKIEKKK